MTVPKPVALVYVGARARADRARQHTAVAAHARAEGYALADGLVDVRDGVTVSELVTCARLHDASVVIVPGGTRMAGDRDLLVQALEPYGITCFVIDIPGAQAAPVATTRRASALPRGRAVRRSDGTS